MYLPEDFNEPRLEVLHDLIVHNPLGVLVTHTQAGLDANHLPFHLQPAQGTHGVLQAHVSRANPVWRELSDGDEVLVVFRAAAAYISPTWYPSKHETHQQVPTWNYQVVHAYGKVSLHDDERYVRGLVAQLTRTHEASQPEPWKMTDAPRDYISDMLKAIVGVEIQITRLVGKFKLGQNKDARDIRGAAQGVAACGGTALGAAMLASLPK
ncbi:FMN-binding negative transcriptional regulator [Pseudomonas aegrilactucae]|uniref:FMN-binding negative transcriptional regulator n=1 Tax=Pseudomonas aegrilactucae TaxID=2854028 RepID=A0A9Q3AFA9_9PSED|nr:FMN-binding negative transcriptional regulator [Pseudomonas aegrilactucae]MBV6289339.1 FMN-binding negative transcriptional regulator [Pseudomonas aegrilactucae]